MDDSRSIIKPPAPSILVAEQETISRTSLSDLLREEGYPVLEAADSGAAVNQICGGHDVKIILADLEMPSWPSIIKQARVSLPKSLILGMVRYGALPNALEAQQLGAHAYLIKPLSFNEVNQWIQRSLSGRSEIPR